MREINEQIIKSDPYFNSGKFVPAAVNPELKIPNCTTFAMCFLHWIMNAAKSIKFFSDRGPAGFGPAKDWWKFWIFEKGQVPKIASVAVWDGNYGHVAIVYGYRQLDDGYWEIQTYESYWQKFIFRKHTYKVKNGMTNPQEGLGKFLGFLYHPYYNEDDPQPDPTPIQPTYVIGKTYTLQEILNVRTAPSRNARIKSYYELTANARSHAYPPNDPKNPGRLKNGTQVTCLESRKVGTDIWIRIPSGWVCAYCKEGTYVK